MNDHCLKEGLKIPGISGKFQLRMLAYIESEIILHKSAALKPLYVDSNKRKNLHDYSIQKCCPNMKTSQFSFEHLS